MAGSVAALPRTCSRCGRANGRHKAGCVAKWVRAVGLYHAGKIKPGKVAEMCGMSLADVRRRLGLPESGRVLPPGVAACVHCRANKAARCRGLCRGCHERPGVRDLYPPDPLERYAVKREVEPNPSDDSLWEPEPTAALPGSPEKVEVLAARAARGERLWHERDAKGV